MAGTTAARALPAPDIVTQLAFSPDGSRLLARTHFGRWLWWRLDPDARHDTVIAHEAELLSPGQGSTTTAAMSSKQRRALRRLDPGPVQLAAPRFLASSCLEPIPPPLPRDPSTPANLLDLTPHATLNPRRHGSTGTTLEIANLCGLPQGVQRFSGVDFDLRATVALDAAQKQELYSSKPAAHAALVIAAGIVIPQQVARMTALELLATSITFVQVPPPETKPVIANVVLHYTNGTTARVPLRYGHDFMMWTQELPPTSHLGWQAGVPKTETGLQGSPSVNLFRVRVLNPYPERAVRSLDIEAMPVTWSGIAVLAITVDPLDPKRPLVSQAQALR